MNWFLEYFQSNKVAIIAIYLLAIITSFFVPLIAVLASIATIILKYFIVYWLVALLFEVFYQNMMIARKIKEISWEERLWSYKYHS